MSEDKPIEMLVAQMLDSVSELRKLCSVNAEAVRNLQETLTAINGLVQVHTRGLQMHQKIIEALAAQAGIGFAPEENPAPEGPIN